MGEGGEGQVRDKGGGGSEGGGPTYEQVVEDTKQTLHKLVSKDRAIIDLLRLERDSRGFMDYLAEVEDQMHLCHNWESLTREDMKRISLLGGSGTGRWRRRQWQRSTH